MEQRAQNRGKQNREGRNRGRLMAQSGTEGLTERVRRYMETEQMAQRGSRIVVGVSGGADSVCLLRILALLAREYDWRLAVVHVNHLIREEAGEDAAFVGKMCRDMQIPFFLKEAPVEELAAQWGVSVEEAGRQVRYQAFGEVAAEFNAEHIAVAHNRNDRAETLLFHLFRGTGLAGMASIRPVRGKIIRPLLCADREEIEAWLSEKKLSWCIDKSNETDTYTRNKIRHHILPFAEKEICREAGLHLAGEAELLARTADYVERQACRALDRCVRQPLCTEAWKPDVGTEEPAAGGRTVTAGSRTVAAGGVHLDVKAFLEEDELLQTHLLKLVLDQLSGGGKDLGAVHVRDAAALFKKQSGRSIMLPYGLEAVRSFDEVVIRKRQTPPGGGISAGEEPDGLAPYGRKQSAGPDEGSSVFEGEEVDLGELVRENPAGQVVLPGGKILEYGLLSVEKTGKIQQKTYTKWLDYDRIESLVVRTRRPGDYLAVNDSLQTKSLKKYLIQEKIPARQRENLLLLADGSHILWVIGHRISSAVKVTQDTRTVLRLHIREGGFNDV